MKKTFLRTIGGAALAISLLTMFTQASGAGKGGGGRLEGTWDVLVTLRDCQSGAEIRSFQSLTTFMSGGTLLDSTSGIPQALKTPGHGVWGHVGDQTYRFSFQSFSFDPAGNFTGWTKITHEAALNSKSTAYTSAGTAEVYGPGGNLLFTGCSTTTATRFE